MVYRNFLLGDNKEQEQAFLAGCRAMMEVFAHSHTDDYNAILSRNDPDWILFLCEKEQARQEEEQRRIAQAITQHYRYDKTQLRGMLLNRARINDNGEDIDENGKVCAKQPYPLNYYWSDNGTEITAEEFNKLTPEEQSKYEEVPQIELRSKSSGKIRRFAAYNRPLMENILCEILPQESKRMMEQYLEALEDDSNEVIQAYRNLFMSILSIRGFTEGFEAWLNLDDDESGYIPDDVPEDID